MNRDLTADEARQAPICANSHGLRSGPKDRGTSRPSARQRVPRVCPHSLRGLNATLALEAGATAQQVASALGHARFSTTAKHYADASTVANMHLRRVAEALGSRPERPQLEPLAVYLKETLSRSDLQEPGRMLGFITDGGTT